MIISDTALHETWCKRRDADAFTELVCRHSSMVFSACMRVLGNESAAEEVVQECFVELMKTSKPVTSSVAGWLHTVATRRSVDRLRSDISRNLRENRYAVQTAQTAEPTWDDVSGYIDQAIAELAEELRIPTVLRFLGNKSHKEIARELDVSLSTVKRRLDKGITSIREHLADKGIVIGAAAFVAMLDAAPTFALPTALAAEMGKLTLAGGWAVKTGASGAAALKSAGTIGGIFAMKKAAIVAVVVGLSGLAFMQLNLSTDEEGAVEVAKEEAAPPLDVPEQDVFEAPAVESEPVLDAESEEGIAGGMVAGQLVRIGTGEPVPDKTITLVSDLEKENLSTTSDAEGWFFMTGVPPGSYPARLVDEEFVVVPGTPLIEVVEGEQTADVLIEVAMGGRITGRVYDGETGAGIAGAKLSASPERFSLPVTPSTDTDAQGRYELTGLDPGSYGVRLDKPDGYPQISSLSQNGQIRMRGVTAKLETEISGVDFELTKGIQIFGKVVDEEGGPLAQVTVWAHVDRGSAFDSVKTKGDGSFAVAGFPPNATVQITASKSGHTTVSREPENGSVEIEEDNVTGVRLVMGPESSISGFLVDTFGNPKANVSLRARKSGPIQARNWQALTGTDGAFHLDELTAGAYSIEVFRLWSSSGNRSSLVENIHLTKGEKITGLRLVFREPEGLTITGRVTNTRGEAILMASIHAQGRSMDNTQTRTDGTYTLAGLRDGTYDVMPVSSDHSSLQPIQVVAGSRNVNFVLSPLAAIEGQVLSARTGEAISSFQVRAQKRGEDRRFIRQGRDLFKSFRDPEGLFLLSKLEDGAATVTARAEGYSEATVDVGVIVGGETVRGLVLRLEDGVELAGRVVDHSGGSISSAQIFLGPVPAEWQRDLEALTRTNNVGEFKLTSLPTGKVTLSVSKREYSPESVTLSLSRVSQNNVEIVLFQGGVIEGFVTLDGTPQPGKSVRARVDGRPRSVQTDSHGHYRMAGLPDGMIGIQVRLRMNETSRILRGQVEVADDMTTEVDFVFAPLNSVIEGVVYEDEGTPVQQRTSIYSIIDVGHGMSESFSARTGQSGTFVFEGLPAGLVNLRVNKQGFPVKNVDLELGDRETIHQDIFLFERDDRL